MVQAHNDIDYWWYVIENINARGLHDMRVRRGVNWSFLAAIYRTIGDKLGISVVAEYDFRPTRMTAEEELAIWDKYSEIGDAWYEEAMSGDVDT